MVCRIYEPAAYGSTEMYESRIDSKDLKKPAPVKEADIK